VCFFSSIKQGCSWFDRLVWIQVAAPRRLVLGFLSPSFFFVLYLVVYELYLCTLSIFCALRLLRVSFMHRAAGCFRFGYIARCLIYSLVLLLAGTSVRACELTELFRRLCTTYLFDFCFELPRYIQVHLVSGLSLPSCQSDVLQNICFVSTAVITIILDVGARFEMLPRRGVWTRRSSHQ
jgi:hypothetical protein